MMLDSKELLLSDRELAPLDSEGLVSQAKIAAREIIDAGTSEVAFVLAHKLEIFLKTLKDEIKEDCIEEIERGNNTCEGVKMKVGNYTKYDYSHCNHEEYNELAAEVEKNKERMKDIEKTLKTLKKPVVTVNEETGETVKILPPSKKITETIRCTFLK